MELVSGVYNALRFAWLLHKYRESLRGSVALPTKFIWDVICYNQGLILEFWWNLKRYEEIKNKILAAVGEKQGVIEDESILRNLSNFLKEAKEIEKFFYEKLWQVYIENGKHIRFYFKNIRGKFAENKEGIELFVPRFVIKVLRQEDKKLVYLFQEEIPETQRLAKPTSIEENTAIKEVVISGRRFLAKDILSIKNYRNPRIDLRCLEAYRESLGAKIKRNWHRFRKKIYVDERWKRCWIDDNKSYDNSFYRSTLVVPITLINNKEISREFLSHIELPIPTDENQSNKRRAIYGFLCFDSIYPNFFDEADVHVGYFFADIFSFYLVSLHVMDVDYSFSDNGAFMSPVTRRLRDGKLSA